MSALFGSRTNAQNQTTYTGVQIQTSSAGVSIPILWGVNKISANVIDLNNFQETGPGKGGKGGGGGKSGKQTDYTTSCILALCEGPVADTDITVWQNAGLLSTASSLNFTLFDGSQGQAPPAWMVDNFPAKALGYTETAYLFSSLFDMGSSPNLPNFGFEVFGIFATPEFPDINFALIVEDFMTSDQYGVDPGASYLDPVTLTTALNSYFNYCQVFTLWGSPYLHTQEQGSSILQRWAQLTNSWIFWAGSSIKFVALGDTPGTANGATYIPNLAPIYNIGPDDFIFDASGEDPVQVDRIDPADGYNNVEIDIKDRALQYASNPIRWQDQASVDQYGLLQSQNINAEEICNASIAAYMAMLIGKRCTYIRNTYSFKLGPNFLLLEPGDIVTLTEPNAGLNLFPVRITEVEEDDKQQLAFKAEELPDAIGTAALYVPQTGSPTPQPDIIGNPGNVNDPPAIFEPSPVFTNGQAQVWLGASGGDMWGGCDVYVSTDGVKYSWIGQITEASQQGVLTATLPLASGLDITNTLAIDTTESNSPISAAVTHADADAFYTASLVENEMLSYGAVAATSTFGANLTYLHRGIYGTAPASHAIGAPFTRINPASALIYPLPQSFVGVPLYFKFLSFNIFGRGQQAISDVSPYMYTPIGVAFSIAAPTGATLAASRTVQSDGTVLLAMTTTWTASIGPLVGSYEVQMSADGGATWTIDNNVGTGASSFVLKPALSSTSYQARVRAISQGGLAISIWDTTAVVGSGAINPSVPATPTGFAAVAGPDQVVTDWIVSSDPSVTGYTVWSAPGLGQPFSSATPQWMGSATSWTQSGLADGSTWTFFLTADNSAGPSTPTSGINVTVLNAGSGQPYDFVGGFPGNPPANQVFYRAIIRRTTLLPISLTGSGANSSAAPGANYTITLSQNGTAIGLINWTAGNPVAGFTFPAAITLAIGDIFEAIGQATPDATTFLNPSYTILATRQ